MGIFCATPPSLPWREHECPREGGDSGEGETPLEMSSIPVSVLKAEKCGRLSGADLLRLLSPPGGGASKVQVVDVRPLEEFKLGSLPGAVSLPPPASPQGVPEGRLGEAEALGQVVAVLSSRVEVERGRAVAEMLLARGVKRVATVHGGVEVFRGANILSVPNI